MTFTVAAHPGDLILFPQGPWTARVAERCALRKRLCSLGGAREHSLEQGQAAQCASVLSRGRLTAGWEVSGGGELVATENLCREAMNTGLENCSPQNPRELAAFGSVSGLCTTRALRLLIHILCPVQASMAP